MIGEVTIHGSIVTGEGKYENSRSKVWRNVPFGCGAV